MITLYNSLAKSTGAEKIDKKGLDMKFSSLPSMMSALHGRGGARRAKAERSDSDSDDESSSEEDENGVEGDIDSESLLGGLRSKLGLQERPAAFLAHLEGLIQHCYVLIYSQICSVCSHMYGWRRVTNILMLGTARDQVHGHFVWSERSVPHLEESQRVNVWVRRVVNDDLNI